MLKFFGHQIEFWFSASETNLTLDLLSVYFCLLSVPKAGRWRESIPGSTIILREALA